jgi:hypothetical protein
MYYIQLTQNYRNYDKLRILDVHFYDETEGTAQRLIFRYGIFRKDGASRVTLFDKTISITEQQEIDAVAAAEPTEGSLWDSVSKILLEYLIDNSIETGTIEVE